MRRPPSAPQSGQQGVILIEVMIAILIFSIGVLALVGLQATMIKNTAEAKYRSEASYIAQSAIGRIWADPATALEPAPGTDISSLLPSGKRIVTQPSPGQYTVTVTWQSPGESAHSFTTTARINGS